MNQQREVIYGYRNEVIESDNPRELIFEVIEEAIPVKVDEFVGEGRDDTEGRTRTGSSPGSGTFPIRVTQEGPHGQTAGGDQPPPDRQGQGGLRA